MVRRHCGGRRGAYGGVCICGGGACSGYGESGDASEKKSYEVVVVIVISWVCGGRHYGSYSSDDVISSGDEN